MYIYIYIYIYRSSVLSHTHGKPLRVIECGRRPSLRSARRPKGSAPSGDHNVAAPLRGTYLHSMPLRVITYGICPFG